MKTRATARAVVTSGLLLVAACGSSTLSRARQLHEQGLQQLRSGRVRAAATTLARADRTLRAVSALAGRTDTLRAANGLALGNAYSQLGDQQRAAAAYRAATKAARRLPHPLLYATLLHNLAALALERDDEPAARRAWEQARSSLHDERRQTNAPGRLELQLRARIHHGLGNCAVKRRDASVARRHFARALALARRAGVRREQLLARGGQARVAELEGEDASTPYAKVVRQAGDSGLPDVLVTLEVNAAASALRTGRFGQALALLDRARDAARRLRDDRKRAAALHNLGGVYLVAGLGRDALHYYRAAWRLQPRPAFLLAQATAQYVAGDLAEATRSLEKLRDRTRAGRRSSRLKEGDVARIALWVALRKGDHAVARAALRRVCPRGERREPQAEVDCRFARAAVALETGDPGRAARHARAASERYAAMADRRGVVKSQILLGRALEGLHRPKRALAAYRTAVGQLERFRPALSSDMLKLSYASGKEQLFERMIALSTAGVGSSSDHHLVEQVVGLMERSRGRGLLDLIQQGKLRARLPAKPALQRELSRRMARVQRLQHTLARSRDPKGSAGAQEDLREAVRRLDALRARMQRALAAHGALAGQPASLVELQRAAGATGRVLISYYLSDERGVAVAVGPEGAVVRVLERPRTIGRHASLLGQLIRSRQDGPEVRKAYVLLARSLYRELIEPLEPLIRDRSLVIVPHGDLLQLPFQALVAADPSVPPSDPHFYQRLRYLLADHQLVYAPSLSIWYRLRQLDPSARQEAGRLFKTGRLLGVGDPSWPVRPAQSTSGPQPGERLLRSVRALLRGERLPGLPHGRAEVKNIASEFGERRQRVLLGQRASESAVKRALREGHYDFVHLAAHGIADHDMPRFSSVVLAPGGEDDGLLELLEIYGLPLSSVRLTVLSACRTAVGRRVAGEGLISLVRGFLAAGSRNVMASVWNVSDESTRLLMEKLYKRLRSGEALAEALRRAQLDAAAGRLGEGFIHPFYWAPFALYGAGAL